jgi:hypothetical protein
MSLCCAGDVIGLTNPGAFAIGDTIYAGPELAFPPIPSFSPELFAYMRCAPNQKKSFNKGIEGLLGEGAVQVHTDSTGQTTHTKHPAGDSATLPAWNSAHTHCVVRFAPTAATVCRLAPMHSRLFHSWPCWLAGWLGSCGVRSSLATLSGSQVLGFHLADAGSCVLLCAPAGAVQSG